MTKLAGLSIDLFVLSILLYGFYLLTTVFKNYSKGNIFTAENARSYRKLSIALLFWIIFGKIGEALTVYVLTYHNVHRIFAIRLQASDFQSIVMLGVVILIAWVMDEGYKIAQDQQLTI